MPEYTPELRAELDAAMARFPVSLPWFSSKTDRIGVTGIHGEPHGEPPYRGVAYFADVFGDARPVVDVMNAVPTLTEKIDADAIRIEALEGEVARLSVIATIGAGLTNSHLQYLAGAHDELKKLGLHQTAKHVSEIAAVIAAIVEAKGND